MVFQRSTRPTDSKAPTHPAPTPRTLNLVLLLLLGIILASLVDLSSASLVQNKPSMTTTPSHDKATPRENQDTRCITSAKVDMDVIPVDGQYQLLLPREPKGGGRGGGGKSGGIGRGGGAAAGGGRGDAGRAIFSVWEQGAILLIGMGLGFILLGAGWI